MPTYEYECPKCGKFEKFQKMSDEPLAKCPKCKSKVIRLLGTGGGIIFKGSGFYQTDSKNKRSSAAKPCDKPKSGGCEGCPSNKQ